MDCQKNRIEITKEEVLALVITSVLAVCIYIQTIIKGFYCGDGNLCGIIYRPYNDYVVEDIAGRFLIKYIAHIRSLFVLGPYTVLFGILCIIISSLLICRMLKIESVVGKVFSTLTVLLYPFFADTMAFRFTADSYMLAFLVSVVAVYIFWEKQTIFKGIIALFFIIMGLNLYQAYFFVTVSLFIVLFTRDLIKETDNDENYKIVALRKLGCAIVVCFIALIFYYFQLSIISPSTSRLVGGEAKFSLGTLSRGLIQSAPGFWKMFIGNAIINNAWKQRGLANLLLTVICIIYIAVILIRRKKHITTIVLVFLSVLIVLPGALNGISIINYGSMTLVMLPTMALPYTFIVAVCEGACHDRQRVEIPNTLIKGLMGILKITLTYVLLVMLVYIGIYQMVQNYYNDKTLNLANRIVTELETKYPDINANSYVYIYGGVNTPVQPEPYVITMAGYILRGTFASAVFNENPQGYLAWNKILEERLGVSFKMYSVTDIEQYLQTEDFQKRPLYPNQDAIVELKDGCYFVKLIP